MTVCNNSNNNNSNNINDLSTKILQFTCITTKQ